MIFQYTVMYYSDTCELEKYGHEEICHYEYRSR